MITSKVAGHWIVAITLLLAAGCSTTASGKNDPGVKLTQLDDRVRVEINGELFTEYFFKNTPRPYCYPVIGPGGAPLTRNFPMKDVAGEDKDHKHHRSLWFAHGDVNGVDFWSEDKAFGRTLHEKFLELKSGPEAGVIKSLNKWVTADGKTVCTDERTLRFHADKQIDFDITLMASDGEVVFGDTKEGSMAIRINESMRLVRDKKPAQGHIITSAGIRDGKTWGTRAEWVDYYGPVDGKTVGIAIFDHPQNPLHPTWWHVRDYGLFAANPFGVHDFEKKAKGAGDFKIAAGQSATFRYRFFFHTGDEQAGKVAEHYQAYVAGAKGK